MKPSLTPEIYTKSGMLPKNPFPGKIVLHVGCGTNKLKGATGMDVLPLDGVDIVQNLEHTPWPVEGGSVDIILAHSVVEHLSDIVEFSREAWRVLKPDGRLIVTVPYFRSVDSYTDITHKHFFTSRSFDYFIASEKGLVKYSYSDRIFNKIGFWYGWPQDSSNPLIRLFKKFILSRSGFYDQYLSLLFPVKTLVWELEPLKS
ncbi:MAG: class I SAM-dependent methyltransferase [Thermodesulfobacteriota bacterium]